jgi:hypothetical protein
MEDSNSFNFQSLFNFFNFSSKDKEKKEKKKTKEIQDSDRRKKYMDLKDFDETEN